MNLLERFVRTRILGQQSRPGYTEQSLERLRGKAERAMFLLRSDAFVEAYQETLDAAVDGLLELDVSDPEAPQKALRLIAKAQAMREITGSLNRAINEHALEDRKRARKVS